MGPTQGPATNPDPNQPNAAAGPQAAPQEKPVDPKMVRAAANDLFKAMDGWGTNEDALLNALRGKSPAEIKAIKAEYADHFGRDLDADIDGELGGKDLEEAKAALTADPVATAVAALDNAANGGMFGMGTDEAKIQSVFEGIKDPAERKKVIEAYKEKTGTSLDDMLKSEMSGNDLGLSQALLEGDATKANAVRLDEAMNGGFLGLGMGTDEDAVYKALEDCKDETQRKALAAAYEKKTGEPLTAALGREFSGAEKDVADNLLAGKTDAANRGARQGRLPGLLGHRRRSHLQVDGGQVQGGAREAHRRLQREVRRQKRPELRRHAQERNGWQRSGESHPAQGQRQDQR